MLNNVNFPKYAILHLIHKVLLTFILCDSNLNEKYQNNIETYNYRMSSIRYPLRLNDKLNYNNLSYYNNEICNPLYPLSFLSFYILKMIYHLN